ncbi:FAD-binding oxidoreductase [Pseudomonas lalucatii]|nr:FAD-binding oxidoreductase [Pseudomonas lalucatii]
MQLHCNFLPQDDGRCGWYETLPPPPPSTPRGTVQADWVVLGAGYAGLAAARRLAELQPEASVVLIDAKRVGFGAAGQLRLHGRPAPRPDLAQLYQQSRGRPQDHPPEPRRHRLHREIVQRHGIDCDWREQGKLHGAANERGGQALEAFAKGLSALGEPYRLLDAKQMKAVTGSDFYQAGLHAPGAVLVQPAALSRGLGQSLPANVRLFEDSPVLDIEVGKPHRLTTAQGCVQAPRLVLANNAYAASFGELGLKGRLLPVYTYGSMTRPLTAEEQARLGGEQSWGLIPADPLGSTVRRLANGRICVRNSSPTTPR